MPGSADRTDLASVTHFLRDEDAAFLAGWLSATPSAEMRLQQRLRVSDEILHRILICRAPRPQRFAGDTQAIASYADVDPTALATALREAAVLAALRQRPAALRRGDMQADRGLLAAARDTAVEQLPSAPAVSRVRELAERTWRAAPATVRQSHDVEAATAWASPALVVPLRGLSMSAVNRWLTDHQMPEIGESSGPLRGLLVAWRGHAVIFVEARLSSPSQRLILAHEHGHLLLDYLGPRQRVLRDAPELLEVLDGNVEPTDAHRAQAALARVPLGLHTHLLRRDDQGGAAEATMVAEDDATKYALELLAPFDELLVLLHNVPAAGDYAERLLLATDMVVDRFDLPSDAAAARAAAGLAALGVRPGFFDR